ncbi:unnamed protein product [Cylicostephanus goldi]|uniref:Uncharacterized protein n=1 Tax=Cylicostephanus goldi TaxID=71465 RepID=A0A3P6SYK6_CYLGO|nr:unnamed protein product [Cylicostephanus goldi]
MALQSLVERIKGELHAVQLVSPLARHEIQAACPNNPIRTSTTTPPVIIIIPPGGYPYPPIRYFGYYIPPYYPYPGYQPPYYSKFTDLSLPSGKPNYS